MVSVRDCILGIQEGSRRSSANLNMDLVETAFARYLEMSAEIEDMNQRELADFIRVAAAVSVAQSSLLEFERI